MKVIVGKCIAGMQLNQYAVKELVKRGSKLIEKTAADLDCGYVKEDLEAYTEDIGDGFLAEKYSNDRVYKDGFFYAPDMYENRDDKIAIEFFEEVGVDKVGRKGITIVEIPDDIEWEICAGDDGWEWVAEKHRTW